MTNHAHLRFGPESPESLLIACKGGFPQSLEKSWGDWIIENFRSMSGLEFLATENRAVVFPDTEGKIYGTASIDVINEILQTEQPDKAYGMFFSRWASAYRERVCQEVPLDGAVICSGIDAPTERDKRPPKVGKVIILYESKPYPFWFASNEKRAYQIYDYFAAHVPSVIVEYQGRHRWPKVMNQWIVEELDIPA